MVCSDQVAAVIPCRNEAPRLGAVVAAVREHISAVIVVDDGSSDGTAEVARAAGAEVVRWRRSEGKGAALVAGWQRAAERGFEFALCLDGDGQHAGTDIPAFLRMPDEISLVVGNRFGDPHKMPWLRRQVNRWMSRKLSRLSGRDLPDTQCGFRRLRLDVLRRLDFEARHFEIESEMILKTIRAGLDVRFVPVAVIYRDEQSKIRPVRDTIRWFQWWRRATCGPKGRGGLQEPGVAAESLGA
ncbi:MAG: glycosyltransferase family 2 protein [Opitutaceae bacterium]|nr:glycosyltransferase family 2 protein [Verrucomicrobiales bacterium]